MIISKMMLKFSESKLKNSITIFTIILLSQLAIKVKSMDLFHIKFIENNESRLIATSNFNYAISSPKLLAKNWRSISINGDEVLVLPSNGNEKIYLTKAQLIADQQLSFIEQLRDEIANGKDSGYTHIATGGNDFSFGSTYGSRSSYSSASLSSDSFQPIQQQQQQQQQSGEMSYSARDEHNFSVSKSNLPYNWSRVFFNNDLITIVYKNGDVKMFTLKVMSLDEVNTLEQLKRDISEMRRNQAQHITNTMSHSMDMVSNVFNNIMGQFPKPPDYRSAVGNMFGDDFPFGPNNSPFSSSAGWPFGGQAASSSAAAGGGGGGNGATGAFAFAAGRR